MVDFLKYNKIYLLISTVVIGAGLLSIFTWNYRYSIDFVGGTNLEYRFDKKVEESRLKDFFNKEKVEIVDVKVVNNTTSIRTKAIDAKQELKLRQDIEKSTQSKISVLRSETVGPTLGRETQIKTITASVIAILGILLYMSYAFKSFNFALAAVIALFHDFLVVIGMYSIISHFFGAEFDTLFVTALLTSMSFSVHDTIVIFDKIREYIRVEGHGNMAYYANRALTETLVRSLNNSITIIFMLIALVLLGGSTIKFFAVTLLIGTITGSYSSPFVATPLIVWLEKRKNK